MRLNRREFIGFAAAGAAGAAGAGLPAPARRARPPVLDYWCTWSAQAALRAGADGWKPPADVALDVAADAAPLAVFGEMTSLRVRVTKRPTRVTVADLAGGEPHDMTGLCSFDGGWLRLPGDRLARIGTACNRSDDRSSPGALVRIS